MDTDLRSDDIRPTDAACYLYAFENPLTGLSPAVAFAVDVECEYVECSDDEEEWEEDVAVSVEWIPFTGRTWRDLVSLSLTDVECCTDGTSPEPSVYYAGVHHRMGTLSVQVLGIAEAAGGSGDGGVGGAGLPQVELRISMSGDLDGLGINRVDLTVTASFTGLVSNLANTEELISLDGLTETENGRWAPVRM